ncbi:MAG: oligosaccharide flippase family protein [Flavobacteriia bacterium]|nr:oligosaccharide flippase family protein [Flavobacteriia bacterium]
MYKRLLSETVIYGIGSILPRLIYFALNPLFTSQINTAEFSKFGQLYALVAFVNVVLTMGFETAYFRYSADKNLSHRVFHTAFWFVFVNAATFLLLMYLLNIPIARIFDYTENPEYIIYFAWMAFFDAICMVPFAYLRFTNQPIKYAAIKIIQNLFQVGLVVLFFFVIPKEFFQKIGMESNVSYPFVANVIGSFFGMLLLFPIIRQVRWFFDWKLFKKMLNYGYPIMIAGLAFVTNENLDKILLRDMIDESEAGAYNGCYKIATLMILMVTAYRLGVEPFFFKKAMDEDAKKSYADVMLYFVMFCGFALVALLGNLDWIKKIIIPNPDYWIAMKIVPIVVVANFFFGVYYNLSTWYKVTDKTYVGTIVSWIGAGATILFNIIFIPKIGFIASAWATLIAYGLMMLISYFWGQSSYRIPYKTRKIVFYMVLSIGFGMLGYHFSENSFIVGNLFVIAYVAIVYSIEKKSLKLINEQSVKIK